MADEIKAQLPHLIIKNTSTTEGYTSPSGGGGEKLVLPQKDRQEHSKKLINQLDSIRPIEKEIIQKQEDFDTEVRGIQVVFESDPNFNLKLESLEFQRSGIELCSSRIENEVMSATVFLPEGKIDYFLNKVIAYKEKETKPKKSDGSTKPQNKDLVESIADIKHAVLESLWTDTTELPDDNTPIWWEVWIRRSDEIDNISFFKERAEALGLRLKEETIEFIDRVVFLAHGTKEHMAHSVSLLGTIAELRLAKDPTSFFTEMGNTEQGEWIEETLERISVTEDINTYACLLDSGVNEGHPLLIPVAESTDMHSYNPEWGTHDGSNLGHGTPMSGLAAYGDLTGFLGSDLPIKINHKLESVKILPNFGVNEPELYGAITRSSIGRVEIENPERNRVFCMAVTTNDYRDRGKPSSWSATIDAISSGAEDEQKRLILLSAGNTDPSHLANYPESNQTDTVQDPGQSWNALTVGGYTEKVLIDDPDLSDYQPIAPSGDLSPSSCTSTNWSKDWPFKPDIVMEAGNMGVDLNLDPPFVSSIDDLELLSTHHQFNEKLLVNFGETSAATALATRLSALLINDYPEFWPETLRGLLVHSAEWTDALKDNFDLSKKRGYRQLLQYCGYGVPNQEKLFWSTSNSLTLIAQDKLQPFYKEGGNIKTRDINLHDIPWPKDILENLGETEVEMKVTLSYFVEPNPGQRGWSNRYRYASHRLQFDVRRSLESVASFKQRINKQARDDEFRSSNNQAETGEWQLGVNLRKTGSIHSDTWIGTASELAPRQHIAVYPLGGWWKELKHHERWGNKARYSLIISISTPETDIYTNVASKILDQVEIEI